MLNNLVAITDQKAVTTSLIVAEAFDKQHKDVLRAITKIECPDDFGRRSFAPSSYLSEQNKPQPMYHITRDGFMLVAMGFTGKKATEFKIRFIEAFNTMERALLEQHAADRRVSMHYHRSTNAPEGLDVRYSVDLTPVLRALPSGERLEVLQRLTGIDMSDIIERLPVTGGTTGTVAAFVKKHISEAEGERVAVVKVYAAYAAFCAERGDKPLSSGAFGKALRTFCPGIASAKLRVAEGYRKNSYENIDLSFGGVSSS